MKEVEVFLAVVCLVGLSAICSGLNVALMSLSPSDLKRKADLGDSRAKTVYPLRKNSHLSLASILLTNVAVISATSLVLDEVFAGLVAGALSTLLIVVFGEVVPQALFTRHALSVTAKTAPLLKLMIILTYPISKPLQLFLDKLFGNEKTSLHSRHELGIIISEHKNHGDSELDEDEIEIVKHALLLSEKRVKEIMTPIEAVYWLEPNTLIDADKIDEIKEANWSRIPVLSSDLETCHGVLLMKSLVDIDFNEHPVSIQELPLFKTKTVGSMTALDTVFRKFIAGRSHLLPVERDDKIVGILTIEDVIEEILGHEIEDEKDA